MGSGIALVVTEIFAPLAGALWVVIRISPRLEADQTQWKSWGQLTIAKTNRPRGKNLTAAIH